MSCFIRTKQSSNKGIIMTTTKLILTLGVVFALAQGLSSAESGAKPLKIFILAGQSNMQGKAQVRTVERLNLTEDSKQMYQDLKMKDGAPAAVEDMYGVYFTAGDMTKGKERSLSVQNGPFRPGYGSEVTPNTTFGPDHTFGLYLRKQVQGPVLIIKTAWGGRNLLQQFRPPSAGPFEREKDGHGNPTGYYYGQIIKHVKSVLADPGQYHPGYDKAAGYEIAGFVWFQGFNDLIDSYYEQNMVPGKMMFSQYSDILTAFIRDLRKDLGAPQMPFVIGAVGFGGPIEDKKDKQYLFRLAQLAPADLPEFKGNVAAIRAEHCWDMEWKRISDKATEAAQQKLLAANPGLKPRALQGAIQKEIKTIAPGVLTPDELKIFQLGTSNEGFHYLGSAYIYGNVGKLMAEAMVKLMGK